MGKSFKSLPEFQKPREKLLDRGPESLSDAELLAIILRTGYEGRNVLEVSKAILKKYPIDKLLLLSPKDLSAIKGMGISRATTIIAARELIARTSQEDTNPMIQTAQDAVNLVSDIRNKKREHLVALYLDARRKLIKKYTVSIGIVNGSLIHPREVFHEAIVQNATSLILIHNHPSGVPDPSDDDLFVTRRIKEAGNLIGISLKDHIVLTPGSFKSIIGMI